MATSTPDQAEQEPVLLTTTQAAKLLGISTQGLHFKRFVNRGPAFIRMGRTVRYRRRDVLAYIERCLHDPEAASPKAATSSKSARKREA